MGEPIEQRGCHLGGGNRVIHMGLLNIIRRKALREKLSIREIARRTGLSRNTVAKHLNSGTVEPRFATPERPSKLDPFADKLAAWLRAEAAKSRKQDRTPSLSAQGKGSHGSVLSGNYAPTRLTSGWKSTMTTLYRSTDRLSVIVAHP